MLWRAFLSLTLIALAESQVPDQDSPAPSTEQEQFLALLNRPLRTGPIQFTLAQQDLSRSPFSPDADLAILLSYPALGLELKARGLYFRPGSGPLPEPVFDLDRMRVETEGLAELASRGLKRLGDVIPELGLPIQVKQPRFNGFEGGRAGSVSFQIVLHLGGPLGIEPGLLAVAAQVTVHSDGKIELDGPLKTSIDRAVPLGATGLVLDGVSLEVDPGDRKETVRLTTHLAPAVGRKEGLSLNVTVWFGLPETEVRFVGRLVLARREVLGRVEGTLSRGEVKGRLLIPDPQGAPRIAELLNADLLFDLGKEGILAEGRVSLLGGVAGQVELLLPFTGEGLLMAGENWHLLGLSIPASVTARFSPGFQELELDADLQVEIDLEVLKVMASVWVHAVRTKGAAQELEVVIRAFGLTVRFRLDHLGQLTAARLRQELSKKLTDLYDNLLQALAALEKEGGDLLAQVECYLRGVVRTAFHRVGLERTRTGHKGCDERLAELASGHKNLMAWGLKLRRKACHWLAQAEPQSPHQLLSLLAGLAKELAALFDPGKRALLRQQAEREQLVDARLAPLVLAINQGEATRTLSRQIEQVCRCETRAARARLFTPKQSRACTWLATTPSAPPARRPMACWLLSSPPAASSATSTRSGPSAAAGVELPMSRPQRSISWACWRSARRADLRRQTGRVPALSCPNWSTVRACPPGTISTTCWPS